jgi:DNA-binding HxlR family transcriptional regulator
LKALALAYGGRAVIGESRTRPRDSKGEGIQGGRPTTAETLRLLGAGASGAILMALGEGPLRTKELTGRVGGYAPRTVYRYANKLTELGVVERHEEPGVPSKVTLNLTQPCGQELHDLVEAYAETSWTRLAGGEIDAHGWGSLVLVADLWESGMIEELNLEPRSLTELARGDHGLSYHQVSRRARLFAIGGFVQEIPVSGRRRCVVLTDKARRAMGLIAGIGRWRRRHMVPEGEAGLNVREVAGLLRTTLPLVSLPEHREKSLRIDVLNSNGVEGDEETVWGCIEADGSVAGYPEPRAEADARAQGKSTAWVDAVLDGPPLSVSTQGEEGLVETCVGRLHAVLWGSGR